MMATKTRALALVAATALSTGLYGCGETASTGVDPAARAEAATGSQADGTCVDLSILRSVMYDYEPVPDPVTYARRPLVDMVVSGTVTTVLEGPSLPDLTGEDPQHVVVLKIAVDDILAAGDTSRIQDGYIYLLAPQGPIGSETLKPIRGLDDWNKQIPTGTKVTAFVGEPGKHLKGALTGEWAKTLPVAAGSQGLIIETCGKLVGGFDDLAGPGWTEYDSLSDLGLALAQVNKG